MHKEIPILFSTSMVRAILEGRKTMTRRIVKPQPDPEGDGVDFIPVAPTLDWEQYYKQEWKPWHWETSEGESIMKDCPYGKPGDLLWVRESFNWDWKNYPERTDKYYFYKASTEDSFLASGEKWNPSIHMPKAACRIYLEITEVRVERLQDISEEDAQSEGVNKDCPIGNMNVFQSAPYKYCFADLWERINGEESWTANPWVWCVSFKVLSTTGKPINKMEVETIGH